MLALYRKKNPNSKLINMLSKYFSNEIERAIVMQSLSSVEAVDNLKKMDDTFLNENSKNRDNRVHRGQGW